MSKHALLGKAAPALSLPNADGSTYEFKPGASGKPTAVFFYPKASTCTRFPAVSSLWCLTVVFTQIPSAAQERCAHFVMR
jgi:peroxiredoxin